MKTVDIYTDGACSGNPGKGGYCAILKYNDKEKLLLPLGLIFSNKVYLVAIEENKGDSPYHYLLHKFSDVEIISKKFEKEDFDSAVLCTGSGSGSSADFGNCSVAVWWFFQAQPAAESDCRFLYRRSRYDSFGRCGGRRPLLRLTI